MMIKTKFSPNDKVAFTHRGERIQGVIYSVIVKKRLGCIGCPLKSDNGLSDFEKYPNSVKAWINAGAA